MTDQRRNSQTASARDPLVVMRERIEKLEMDLVRNKRARRKLSLLNSIQESRLSSLTLLQDVVEKIPAVDNIPRLFVEVGAMLQGVCQHEVSGLYLRQTGKIYLNSRGDLAETTRERLGFHLVDCWEEESGLVGDEQPEMVIHQESSLPGFGTLRQEELAPAAVLPIRSREELIGSIGIFATRVYPFTVEQRSHLHEIVRNVSMLLDNAVLYERTREANRELERRIGSLRRLLEIGQAIAGPMTFAELIDYILAVAMREIEADGGSLMLLDPRKRELHLEAIQGLPDDVKSGFRLKLGEGIAGLVAEEQEPWILVDSSLYSDELRNRYGRYTLKFFPFDKYQERGDVKSAVSVPLIAKHGILGVLNLTSKEKIFSEADLEMVILFGSLAANTMENRRLAMMEEKRVKELVKLADVGKLLSATFEHGEIIDLVINALNEILRFNVAVLFVEEDGLSQLTAVSPCNISVDVVEWLKEFVIGRYGRLSSREVDSSAIEISLKKIGNTQMEISEVQFGSIIHAPLSIKGQTRGILSLLAFDEDFFDEDAERTLSTFAATVAVSLDNSASYEKMERTVKELSMLFEVSKSMTSTLDLDEALTMIVSISAELMDARIAFLRLPDMQGNLIVKASYGDFDQELGEINVPADRGISGRAFTERKPVVVDQIATTDVIAFKDQLLSHGLNSCLAVPLHYLERSIGVITCFFDEVKHFTESEINLLSALASHASIAIKNAEMYEDMNRNYTETIMALSAAIDAKDHYTHGHSRNVMEYAVAIARELGMGKEEIETVKFAGLLHDIGKIGIPELILRKSTGLTDEEFRIISSHPKLGAAIMEQVNFLKKISPLAYHHHERYDGGGYPDGLSGDDIPLGARILNLADSFDVMTTARVYRSALPFEEALSEVKRCRGKQFDPEVVDAFIRVIDKVFPAVKQEGVNSIVELVRKSYEGELI